MNINKAQDGDLLTISLEGRLDTLTSPDLEKVLKEALDQVKHLVFDLKNLEYISSAGLRVLLFAKKTLHNVGTVKIINSNTIVKEVFEVTGFNEILDVE